MLRIELLGPIVAAFLVSRALLLAAGGWALAHVPIKPGDGAWHEWQPGTPALWIEVFSRWDSRWFYYVALQGYWTRPAGEQSNLVFPPLLPALMKLGALAVGQSSNRDAMLGAGVIAANVALLTALVYLSILVRRSWGRPAALRAVLCILLFPTSFFLSAAYSDSLFLAFSIATFVYAAEDRWLLVGILGALAALSRTYGVLLVVPLACEYVARHGFRLSRQAAWLALIPLAFCAWVAYLIAVSGDPLVLSHVENTWTRQPMPPWQTLGIFFSEPITTLNFKHAAIDLFFTLGAFLLVVLTWWLKKISLGLFASLFFLPTVSTGILVSNPRYAVLLFPGFIVLAQLTRFRPLLALYTVAAGGYGLYLMGRFATGWWVA